MSEETPKIAVKYNKDKGIIEVFRKVGNNLVGADLTSDVVNAALEYIFDKNEIGFEEDLMITRHDIGGKI